jgi:hypothetical protein
MVGMKSFFKRIEYLIDVYIVYLLYSERKQYRYRNYMKNKWEKKNEV